MKGCGLRTPLALGLWEVSVCNPETQSQISQKRRWDVLGGGGGAPSNVQFAFSINDDAIITIITNWGHPKLTSIVMRHGV